MSSWWFRVVVVSTAFAAMGCSGGGGRTAATDRWPKPGRRGSNRREHRSRRPSSSPTRPAWCRGSRRPTMAVRPSPTTWSRVNPRRAPPAPRWSCRDGGNRAPRADLTGHDRAHARGAPAGHHPGQQRRGRRPGDRARHLLTSLTVAASRWRLGAAHGGGLTVSGSGVGSGLGATDHDDRGVVLQAPGCERLDLVEQPLHDRRASSQSLAPTSAASRSGPNISPSSRASMIPSV